MLNQVILVGRISKELEIKESEEGKKLCTVTLAIPRSFKNQDGVYDTDFIKCFLWNSVAENTKEYCHKGDLIGIKGRLQNNNEVIAEKVTFLSTNKEEE